MKLRPASAFRLSFFTGLALELSGPLVWAVITRSGSRQLRVWRYSLSDERLLFHWFLPVALALAYVWLARARQPAWRWAAWGAVLGGLPHLLAAGPRFALLWSLQPKHVRARGAAGMLGLLEPFVRDMARSTLFVTLLAGTAALLAALAIPHRASTRPRSREWLVRRKEAVARAHLFLGPIAAACVLALPWCWPACAFVGIAAMPGPRSFRSLRLLTLAVLAGCLGRIGEWIAHARPDYLHVIFLAVPRFLGGLLYFLFPISILALPVFVVAVPAIVIGFAYLPALGLSQRRPWACPVSVGVLAACFLAVSVTALWLAADPPPLMRTRWWVAPAAIESWLLTAAAYAGVPLVLLGTMWRFVERDDVRRLCGE
jgi:hypothetical protein